MGSCDRPSNTRYTIELCRCDGCRAANTAAERRRSRARAIGERTWVPGDEVRERIRILQANGMSRREICRAAGLSGGSWNGLMHRHWRTGKPVTRVKRETAERIFAITRRHYSPGQQVSREPMDRRIVEMLREGYSIAAQARISGVDHQVLRRWSMMDARTVNVRDLVRYMETTSRQLEDWCREDRAAKARAINQAISARGTVLAKWSTK